MKMIILSIRAECHLSFYCWLSRHLSFSSCLVL